MAVVLASQSPQRSAILAQLGIPFRVIVPIVDEIATGVPEDVAITNASMKADAAAVAASSTELIVACDTIVVVDDEIYGKPESRAHAGEMLGVLSGKTHRVLSAVSWRYAAQSGSFVATTDVTFRSLSKEELEAYIETGEWRGRAGGYAIQGSGSGLVRGVSGCFWNVVGFPGPAFLDVLNQHDLREVAFAQSSRPVAALDDPRSILTAELRDAVVTAMAARPEVIGVWQGGSAAFGRDDADSDLDIQALVTQELDQDQLYADVQTAINAVSPVAQAWRVPDLPSWSQMFYRIADDDLLLVDLSLIPVEDDDWYLQPERHGEALILHDPQGVIASAPHLDVAAHESRMMTSVAKALHQATMFSGFVGKELRRGRSIDARWVYNQLVLAPLIVTLGATYRPERYDFGWRYLHDDLPEDIRGRLERLIFADIHELEASTREANGWTVQLAEALLADRGVTSDVSRAADEIIAGNLIGLPTETVYGLAADAANQAAVERIFAVKQRPSNSPLIVHLYDAGQMEQWADHVSTDARLLAEHFWPGPLTLVLKSSGRACAAAVAGGSTVALRVPDHPLARAVIQASGSALAAPSANRHGQVSPTRAADVRASFSAQDVPVIVDGGTSVVGVESTIVDASGPDIRVLRLGGIAVDQIEAVLGHPVELAVEHLQLADLGTTLVPVPGQARSHYAPRAEVRMAYSIAEATQQVIDIRASHPDARVGLISDLSMVRSLAEWGDQDVVILLAEPDSRKYAAKLYGALNASDRRNLDFVVAVPPSHGDLRDTILDRLTRASATTR